MEEDRIETNAVELATELTIAWLSNPNTRPQASEVPDFLRMMHDALTGLTGEKQTAADTQEGPVAEPAVSVRKSLASPEHIISLIDGKAYKTLKRHLANNGLTPDQYRKMFGLKSDYPMVAPAYSERRRGVANAIGLGRKPRQSGIEVERSKTEPKRRRKAAENS